MSTRSIAVLPLASRTDDGSGLGQGIADEIIHALSWVDGLRVAPIASSMRFTSASGEFRAVADRLRVDTLLLGELQRTDGRFELKAQLLEPAGNRVLWTSDYDVPADQLQDAVDNILRHVARTLDVTIRDEKQLSVKPGSTANAQAYDAYLHGLNYYFRYAAKNLQRALQMFEQAVKADSAFARAWAKLAECHAKYFMYYDSTGREHVDRALAASKRAVELAPEFSRAHAARGVALLINKDFAAAEDAFTKAVEINPRLFDAWYQHARACFQQGNLKRAAELFERAAQIQPEDYQTPLLLRQVYLSLGRVDEAKATAQRGLVLAQRHLELNAKDARAVYLACGSMIQLGMYQQAMQWSEKALAIDPDDPMINYNVACCYAQAGEPEKALDCLEKAKGSGNFSAGWLKNDSDLFSLHDHPRFRSLLEELRAQ
ncbi:MAG TPA: tetratricopeptide repeat protein [Gammaproteobacteria bacterium]